MGGRATPDPYGGVPAVGVVGRRRALVSSSMSLARVVGVAAKRSQWPLQGSCSIGCTLYLCYIVQAE
jgi:hypothetical protein